ncbi:MAG TPA: helix-turn-helix domain-containing protein [Candidatus Anaerobutyricum avicola]|nr:helix-turn-helix domain-containing protein [Candidatus Anaerobutyricum avicola]
MDEQTKIENLYQKDMTMAAIAKCYGCHCSTIGRILRRRNVPIR